MGNIDFSMKVGHFCLPYTSKINPVKRITIESKLELYKWCISNRKTVAEFVYPTCRLAVNTDEWLMIG